MFILPRSRARCRKKHLCVCGALRSILITADMRLIVLRYGSAREHGEDALGQASVKCSVLQIEERCSRISYIKDNDLRGIASPAIVPSHLNVRELDKRLWQQAARLRTFN